MKVILISSLYGVGGGGAGVITHHLAQGLSEEGHTVAVITIGETRHCSVRIEQGIQVYRFQPLNLYRLEEKDRHPWWQKFIWQIIDIYNFHVAGVVQRVLANESPDIVHINKMRGFSGAIWSTTSQSLPGRVIQTCHDYESMSPDGLLRGSIGKMALQRRWPIRAYQLIRKRLSAGVSVVTAPSRLTLKRVTDSGLFPFAHCEVIPNTHGWSEKELKAIHTGSSFPANRQVRFLFLGRLEPEKGIVQLCEAFLLAFRQDPSIQLDIAGWGMLETELHRKYGSHGGINFLGMVDGETKHDALRHATVIVVPSLVDEVFGLVTVEAYAYGKPVIASNIGGLTEIVKEGETGWLVEPGNIVALAHQLRAVLAVGSSVLTRMSQSCREYSYRFSMDTIMRSYLEVYSQLLK